MSTIRVDNLQAADGLSSSFTTTGVAKAAWQYDQTGPTTDSSFNTSSLTDVSTGNYDWVPTNNMADALWYAGTSYLVSVETLVDRTVHMGDSGNKSASFGTFLTTASNSGFDAESTVIIAGDLA